jgi:alkyl hydroperoxide reductase subunit AhpC
MLSQEDLDLKGLPITVRSVFILDTNKVIRLMITYPPSCGRNFDEIMRVIDSLQLTTNKKITTPVNWKKGDDVIIAPSVSDEEAKKLFGEFKTIKPYLRYTEFKNVE